MRPRLRGSWHLGLLVLGLAAAAQPLRIVERADWSRWKDGVYLGHAYREGRATLGPGDGAGRVRGDWYLFEETLRDLRAEAKALDQSGALSLGLGVLGSLSGEDSAPIPSLRGLLDLSRAEGLGAGGAASLSGPEALALLRPGLSFVAPGLRLVLLRGEVYRLPFLAEYSVVGAGSYANRKTLALRGKFATRLARLQSGLSTATGSHELDISLDAETGLPLFVRDRFDDSYGFSDGGRERAAGSNLVFWSGGDGMGSGELLAQLGRVLGAGAGSGPASGERGATGGGAVPGGTAAGGGAGASSGGTAMGGGVGAPPGGATAGGVTAGGVAGASPSGGGGGQDAIGGGSQGGAAGGPPGAGAPGGGAGPPGAGTPGGGAGPPGGGGAGPGGVGFAGPAAGPSGEGILSAGPGAVEGNGELPPAPSPILELPPALGLELGPGEGGVSLRIKELRFRADTALLLPEEGGRLDLVAKALLSVPADRSFLVEGFAAATGRSQGELELSAARAKAVVDALVARGIPASRFIWRGLGSARPLASNDSEEGRARNRRVEITILD